MKTFFRILFVILLVLDIVLASLLFNLYCDIKDGDYVKKEDIVAIGKKYTSGISIFRKLFNKDVVYLDGNSIMVEQIKDNIPHHNYDYSYLESDALGKISYNDPNIKSYQGVDVSHYSEDIDWKLVKEDGIYFAMLRLGYRGYSQGVLNFDEYFTSNYEGCIANDIKVGVYFFSQAINEEEAIEEANYVLDNIKGMNITFPIAYDFEVGSHETGRAENVSREQICKNTKAFLKVIEDAGYTPMVYGGGHYMLGKQDDEILSNYEIWFAHYATQPYYPYQFGMWQYTESGSVNGIKNPCDRNISFKDYSEGK